MELQQIVDRYAEAIAYIDVTGAVVAGVNPRTKLPYRPGFKALKEGVAVAAIDDAWEHLHPGERRRHRVGVRYPAVRGTACDHVFTTDAVDDGDEWGIEVKRLQFVGDNGKKNDFAIGKVLSPYLKDRGLLHDAVRLREHGFTRRVGVIAYSFDYDAASLAELHRRHTSVAARLVIREIEAVVRSNGIHLRTRPLYEFADAILNLRGLIIGPRGEAEFEAWRHPAGGRGVVFGWEVRRPHLEPDYDSRHPW